jgi:hypothetical protein
MLGIAVFVMKVGQNNRFWPMTPLQNARLGVRYCLSRGLPRPWQQVNIASIESFHVCHRVDDMHAHGLMEDLLENGTLLQSALSDMAFLIWK